jgi:hypothetical protein
MLYALFFLLGVFATRFAEIVLQVNPLYKVWKIAEWGSLKILSEAEVLRRQALAILEICYADVDKAEEFTKIKKTINKKHEQQQEALINLIRKLLPYETNYKTPQEAYKFIEAIAKKGEWADE